MENFDWTRFTLKIAINTTISKLYDAWTKASELEKWFLSQADSFDTNGNILPKTESIREDYRYEWNWFLYPDIEMGTFTQANGKNFLQFTFAGQCFVDISLTEQDDFVIVELTQKNIPTDDVSKKNIRLGCHGGWSFYLVNLKSVYEGGLDLRNKNTDLKPMLNN